MLLSSGTEIRHRNVGLFRLAACDAPPFLDFTEAYDRLGILSLFDVLVLIALGGRFLVVRDWCLAQL